MLSNQDPRIKRISYATYKDGTSIEDWYQSLANQEPITNEEKVILGLAPPPEEKKKHDEILKRFVDEDSIISNTPKRSYNGLYVYGDYFPPENDDV